jgi:RNA recognition motif-containing protein
MFASPCRHAETLCLPDAVGRPFIQEMRKMEAKLYVGNLPYSTTDADLQTLFAQAGTVVSAAVVKDRESGRSKGFGFVEMSSNDEAQQAISQFDGKDFQGRTLKVNVARPREEGGGRRGGGRRDY